MVYQYASFRSTDSSQNISSRGSVDFQSSSSGTLSKFINLEGQGRKIGNFAKGAAFGVLVSFSVLGGVLIAGGGLASLTGIGAIPGLIGIGGGIGLIVTGAVLAGVIYGVGLICVDLFGTEEDIASYVQTNPFTDLYNVIRGKQQHGLSGFSSDANEDDLLGLINPLRLSCSSSDNDSRVSSNRSGALITIMNGPDDESDRIRSISTQPNLLQKQGHAMGIGCKTASFAVLGFFGCLGGVFIGTGGLGVLSGVGIIPGLMGLATGAGLIVVGAVFAGAIYGTGLVCVKLFGDPEEIKEYVKANPFKEVYGLLVEKRASSSHKHEPLLTSSDLKEGLF